MKSKYLLYKDTFITIFNDSEKCSVVFLTDNGETKAINYDDNFFYVEQLLDTYLEMITKSFGGFSNRDKIDWCEIKQYLKKYYKHLKRQNEIELLNCCVETRGLLK